MESKVYAARCLHPDLPAFIQTPRTPTPCSFDEQITGIISHCAGFPPAEPILGMHAPSRLWHRCGRGRYVRAVVVLLNMIDPHQSAHRAASYANSTFSLPIRNKLVFLYSVLENPLSSLSSHITSLTPCFQRRTLPPRGRRRPAGTSEGTPSPASASVGARLPADRIGRERENEKKGGDGGLGERKSHTHLLHPNAHQLYPPRCPALSSAAAGPGGTNETRLP